MLVSFDYVYERDGDWSLCLATNDVDDEVWLVAEYDGDECVVCDDWTHAKQLFALKAFNSRAKQ